MNIDAHGNKHQGAGTPGGGQFAGHVHSAPAAGLVDEPPTPMPTEADALLAAFERESEAAWDHVRALRAPAVAAATAYIRERHPDAGSIHLYQDYDEDTAVSYVSVENVVSRHGEYLELDVDEQAALEGIIRSVADNNDDLAQLPTAYQVPGTGTYVLPVPQRQPGDESAAEEAFSSALDRGVYDNDLAGVALRSAGKRLFPDAEALLFEMNYTDGGGRALDFDGVRGGIHDGETAFELEGWDTINEIPFSMSGKGDTGAEITGIRHVKGDSYIFDLAGTDT